MKKLRSKVIIFTLVMLCFLISALSVSTFAEEYQNIAIIESPDQQSDTFFGFSVDLFENTLIIGEPKANIGEHSQAGKVYIYDLDGNLINTLQAPMPQTGGRFGYSIAIKGDIILVGEPGADVDDYDQAGQVHIYNAEGNLQSTITAPTPDTWGSFGISICFSGDTIIVGEPDADSAGSQYNSGEVHTYDSEGNFLETIQSPEPVGEGNFGQSLAGQEDTYIVGEPFAYVGETSAGKAHIFDSDGNLVVTLQSPAPEYDLQFGISVAISGNIVVVGEPYAWTDSSTPNAGKAYIFDTDGNLLASIQSPKPDGNAMFGNSLDMSGDLIIASEYGADGDDADEGRAHVFDTDGNLIMTLKSPSPYWWNNYGNIVKIKEGIIIVQEYGTSKIGKVYVYTSSTTPTPKISITISLQDSDPNALSDSDKFWIRGSITPQYSGIELQVDVNPSTTLDYAGMGSTSPPITVTTDINGEFEFSANIGIEEGSYHTVVTHVGNETYEGDSVSWNTEITKPSAPKGNIKITVKEGDSSLNGVTITSTIKPNNQVNLIGTTNTQGIYQFDNILVGSYTFKLEKEGYTSKTTSVQCLASQTNEITVNLVKEQANETGGGGIPGFPIESLVLSIMLGIVIMWMMRKKN